MKKPFISFLLIALVLIHAGITRASVLGHAEIISPVNLRQGPGLDSRIISVLKQGQKVTVLETRSNWSMVSVDSEKFGFRGWVYGDYLARLNPPEPPAASSKQERGLRDASTEAANDVRIPVQAVSGTSARVAEENPGSVQAASGTATQESGGAPAQADHPLTGRGKTLVIQELAAQSPETQTHIQLGTESKATVPDIRAEPPRREAASLRQAAGSPGRPEAGRTTVDAVSAGNHSFPFVGLALKLSMVLFCCISLVLSARAYTTAKEARKTTA